MMPDGRAADARAAAGPWDAHTSAQAGPADVQRVVARAPVFAGSRQLLEPLLARGAWPSLDELSTYAGVRCVPDERAGRRRSPRRRSDLYDARITEQGALPTRPENWHDLFNVVTWQAFPRAKRALHARQYRRLCERVPELFERLPGERTVEQSALTQLDEGGLLLSLPREVSSSAIAALSAQLRDLAKAREALTNEHLAPFGARARVFGHAVHEHLALGGRPPRAAVLLLPHPPAELDDALAAWLSDDTRPFVGMAASAWVTPWLDTGA
ncbi:MAG: DUF3025 domain-containing protein [Myxococcales bacterium]|nr:DUF3025 domain-containing protein [Myxococcales bacterium]